MLTLKVRSGSGLGSVGWTLTQGWLAAVLVLTLALTLTRTLALTLKVGLVSGPGSVVWTLTQGWLRCPLFYALRSLAPPVS